MATHAAIQAAIDSYFAANQSKFINVENGYIAGHPNRYFQGIITPTVPPDDGAVQNPDFTKKPTDQAETWAAVFTAPNDLPNTNWPASLRIDVYRGPQGNGYVISGTYTKGGETWARSINTGPETWRDRPWERVA